MRFERYPLTVAGSAGGTGGTQDCRQHAEKLVNLHPGANATLQVMVCEHESDNTHWQAYGDAAVGVDLAVLIEGAWARIRVDTPAWTSGAPAAMYNALNHRTH